MNKGLSSVERAEPPKRHHGLCRLKTRGSWACTIGQPLRRYVSTERQDFPTSGAPLCIDVAATTVTAMSTALVVMNQDGRPRNCTQRALAPQWYRGEGLARNCQSIKLTARPHVKLQVVVPDRIRPKRKFKTLVSAAQSRHSTRPFKRTGHRLHCSGC